MTELRAILAALARASWNLGWRFSRAKILIWRGLLSVGIAAVVLWRLDGQVLPPGFPLLPLLVIGLESGLFALLISFMRGRGELFDHRSAALFHLSPAPTWSILGGRILIHLPGRLFSSMLLTLVTLRLLPVEHPLLWAPLLVLTALLAGLLGQLAGLLGLIGLARLWPRTVELSSLIGLLCAVVLAAGLVGVVAAGAPLEELVALLLQGVDLLILLLGLLVLVPGLALGLMLLLRPTWVGDLYRSAFLAVAEANEAAHKLRRSWLPRPFVSPAWALAMKEWRQFSRNRLNLFRSSLLLLLIVIVTTAVGREAREQALLIAIGVGVGGTWLAFAEVVAALFAADEERAELFIIGGIRPIEYLGGKLLGALPLALLAGGVSSLIGGLLGAPVLLLGGLACGLFLGVLGAILGPAAAGFTARTSPWLEAAESGLALREQLPSDLGAWIGFLLSGGIAAAGIYLSGAAAAPLLGLLLALGGGALALLAGLPRLRRLLIAGRTD